MSMCVVNGVKQHASTERCETALWSRRFTAETDDGGRAVPPSCSPSEHTGGSGPALRRASGPSSRVGWGAALLQGGWRHIQPQEHAPDTTKAKREQVHSEQRAHKKCIARRINGQQPCKNMPAQAREVGRPPCKAPSSTAAPLRCARWSPASRTASRPLMRQTCCRLL